MGVFGGPMFEQPEDVNFKSIHGKQGGHYNNFSIKPGRGMEALHEWFPHAEANEMNFVLFSTSGAHGTYTTIEEIEASLTKYGENPDFDDDGWPDDYSDNELTVLIVQPRLCTVRHGLIPVTLADIPFLKALRLSSWDVVRKIGAKEQK